MKINAEQRFSCQFLVSLNCCPLFHLSKSKCAILRYFTRLKICFCWFYFLFFNFCFFFVFRSSFCFVSKPLLPLNHWLLFVRYDCSNYAPTYLCFSLENLFCFCVKSIIYIQVNENARIKFVYVCVLLLLFVSTNNFKLNVNIFIYC